MGQKFFISFNSSDRQKAHWIAYTLQQEGHEVAVHDWEVPAGANAPIWMEERLRWADRLIAVISPAYGHADFSMMEWAAGVWGDPRGHQGSVVPILVEPTTDIPILIRALSRIDLTGVDEDAAKDRLLKGISAPAPPKTKPEFVASLSPEDSTAINSQLPEESIEEYLSALKYRCGTVRVIGMTSPVALDSLFSNVSLLRTVKSTRYASTEKLSRDAPDDSKGLVSLDDAIKATDKMFVWGRPGTGKTVFLKSVALRLSRNYSQSKDRLIPMFVNLNEWADSKRPLIDYAGELMFSRDGAGSDLRDLIRDREICFLMDGLDEVPFSESVRVMAELEQFTNTFYQSKFIVTSRPGGVGPHWDKFTEFELAPFNFDQVREFTFFWFRDNPLSAEKCISHISSDPRLLELTRTPLLLALLCVVFDAEGSLPGSKSLFFDEAINVLIRGWDDSRGIRRDARFKQLSDIHKKDLYSSVAETFFDQEAFLFPTPALEDSIRNYYEHDLGITLAPLEVKATLDAMEQQHGVLAAQSSSVYAFSHLTFQEFFVARKRSEDPERFRSFLAESLTDPRWREVIVLSSSESRERREHIEDLTLAIEERKTTAVRRALQTVQNMLEQSSSIPTLTRRVLGMCFAVYDRGLTSPMYWDKSIAGMEYCGPLGIDLGDIPDESYRNIRDILSNALRNLGGAGSDFVSIPTAVWRGYETEWGHGPSIKSPARSCDIDLSKHPELEEHRFLPSEYEDLEDFVYSVAVLIDSLSYSELDAVQETVFAP